MQKGDIRKAMWGLAAFWAVLLAIGLVAGIKTGNIMLGVVLIFTIGAALTVDMWTSDQPEDPDQERHIHGKY